MLILHEFTEIFFALRKMDLILKGKSHITSLKVFAKHFFARGGRFSSLCIVVVRLSTLANVGSTIGESDAWSSRAAAALCCCALVASVYRSIKGQNKFSWSLLDTALVVLSLCFVANVMCVTQVPCATIVLRFGVFVCVYFSLRILLGGSGSGMVSVASAIELCGFAQAVWGIAQFMGFSYSGNPRFSMTGTFFNPGPFAGYLCVAASVAVAEFKRSGRMWHGVAAFVMLLALSMAWSRGAMLAFGLAVALLYRKELSRKRHYVILASIIAIVLCVLMYFAKPASANGRLFMALVSLRNSGATIMGNGVGSFLHSLSEGEAVYFSENPQSAFISEVGVAEFPFNEFLRMLVECGVVGLAAGLFVAGVALFNLCKDGKSEGYALIALMVFALFSYPLSLMPFILLLAVLLASAGSRNVAPSSSGGAIAGILVATAAVALSLVVLQAFKPRIAATSEWRGFSMMKNPAFVGSYYDLLPYMADERRFLFSFATLLRETGRYNDSNAMLRQGALVSNDPMFEVIQGNNYQSMGETSLADSCYQRAFFMQPNRVYPLYRLMKLYENVGDSAQTLLYARKVVSFNPKVKSSATREMKQEAGKIILSHENAK